MEVDIDGCLTTTGDWSKGHVLIDGPESTSSFSDSLLDADHDVGEAEVQSNRSVDPNTDPLYDGRVLEIKARKKRTEHWRRFIHPVTWRCKWMELQLREIQSKIENYNTLLSAASNRKKQLHAERHPRNQSTARSLAFDSSGCTQQQKLLKRKRRIRCEETSNLVSYMENHYLFSYFGRQKAALNLCKDDSFHDDTLVERAAADNNDNWLEEANWRSLEAHEDAHFDTEIMKKIEVSQMLVRKLRVRVQRLLDRFPQCPSINSLCLPLPSNAVDRVIEVSASPSNDSSSLEETIPLTDILQSLAMEHAANSCENAEEQILIHNEAAKEEMRDLRNIGGTFLEPCINDNSAPIRLHENSPNGSLREPCDPLPPPKSKRGGKTKKITRRSKKGSRAKRSKKA